MVTYSLPFQCKAESCSQVPVNRAGLSELGCPTNSWSQLRRQPYLQIESLSNCPTGMASSSTSSAVLAG